MCQATAHERGLVTTGVVAHLGVLRVALPVDAGTAEDVQEVSAETIVPVDAGITLYRVLFRSQRTNLIVDEPVT